MGDPKFVRRSYDKPKHPWEATRMEEERKLLAKYGLKNKRELWKAQSMLRGFRRQARDLQARLRAGEPQAERETTLLIERLVRLGVLPVGTPTIDDVLALTTEEILRRRLEALRADDEINRLRGEAILAALDAPAGPVPPGNGDRVA